MNAMLNSDDQELKNFQNFFSPRGESNCNNIVPGVGVVEYGRFEG